MTYEYRAAGPDEIGHGECKIVQLGSIEVGVFRIGQHYRAWRNVCPHTGAPVCRGRVEGTMLPSKVYEYHFDEDKLILRCPWHGWEYDLETGRHLADHNTKLKGYPVIERSDGVYIVLPDRPRRRHIDRKGEHRAEG